MSANRKPLALASAAPPQSPQSLAEIVKVDAFPWSPPAHAKATSLLPVIRARQLELDSVPPAGARAVRQSLAGMVCAMKSTTDSPQTARARAAIWERLFADVPSDLWQTAVREALLSHAWLPAPADMRALLVPLELTRHRERIRLRKIAEIAAGPPPPLPIPPAEMATRRRAMATRLAELAQWLRSEN